MKQKINDLSKEIPEIIWKNYDLKITSQHKDETMLDLFEKHKINKWTVNFINNNKRNVNIGLETPHPFIVLSIQNDIEKK